MLEFILKRIKDAKNNIGVEAGQAKYRSYFITNSEKFSDYKADADTNLRAEGYQDCIVTE